MKTTPCESNVAGRLASAPNRLRWPAWRRPCAATRDADVKLAAAQALGKINSPESIQALAVALDDRDPAMQYVGVQSLKSITGKDYGPDVQAWRQVAAGGTPPSASSAVDRGTDS